MSIYVGRTSFIEAESLEYFRKAVYASYDGYTSYSYIEESGSWNLYSEISPDITITYSISKGSSEETVFLSEKHLVKDYTPRKRVNVITSMEEHTHPIYENSIQNILNELDGYALLSVEDQRWNQSSTERDDIREALDGYASDLVEITQDILNVTNTLDGYALSSVEDQRWNQSSTERDDIRSALDGYYDGYNTFGTYYTYVSSEGRSVTTSKSYQTKVTMNTGILNGFYRVSWTAVGDGDDDETHRYRLRDVTNNTTLSEFRIEPEENNNRFHVGDFRELEFNDESRQLKIQWRSGDSGEDAAIRQARIELWRVK